MLYSMAKESSSAKKINPKKKDEEQEKRSTFISPAYKSADKLLDKVAIITGGDSGIGRAVAIHFAKEGCNIAIVYKEHDEDAKETETAVKGLSKKCLLLKGDISVESFCIKVVKNVLQKFGKIDILVNNAAIQIPEEDFEKITSKQFKRTFEVNIFSFFYFAREVLKVLSPDGCIINTASVVAYRGSSHLIDYSSTKGAIVAFTRSLSKNLASKGIRVNAVAPGPVWTPLVLTTFDKKHLETFGQDTPMQRAGYPYEIAPAFVFLASSHDASFITGQVIHVNGGEVVNS
jgi:NAD(P)-dependent dehydrogenase (short-subunit alcohol dehydrogenase family)